MADLRAASLADVRAFHDRYYAPDNAVLAVAGDFEPAQAMEMVRGTSDDPPRRAPAWQDPGFTAADRRAHGHDDRPARRSCPPSTLVWHIPARRTPDHYALEVLGAVLGMGESSRLYQELVKTREIASEVNVYTEDRRGPDLLRRVVPGGAGPHRRRGARGALRSRSRVARRRRHRPRAGEGEATSCARQFVFGLQSNLARARQLAEYELYDGNAALLRTELDRYLAVTREPTCSASRGSTSPPPTAPCSTCSAASARRPAAPAAAPRRTDAAAPPPRPVTTPSVRPAGAR
jgi:zinc protease